MNGYPHEYDKKNYNIKQYKTTKIQSINNFNDLQLSNGINANAPLRINNNSMNNFLGNEVNNSIDDDNNNNIRILDFGLHRNNLNTLRLTNNVSNSNENGDRSNNIHINSINFSDINDNL